MIYIRIIYVCVCICVIFVCVRVRVRVCTYRVSTRDKSFTVGKSSSGPDGHAILGKLHLGEVPELQLVIPRCREKTFRPAFVVLLRH